jgi:Holliday junction DNA helicase RuvA
LIGQIRGIIVAKNPPEILVEVAGITYEIQVPMSTLYKLPELGQQLLLHTHFVVREDAQLLYGFYESKDKTMFRSLIKVNGVGPKMALAILSGMEPDEFVRIVRSNDVTAMINMPGIGKKNCRAANNRNARPLEGLECG